MSDGAFFIDRNGQLFSSVLDYLRGLAARERGERCALLVLQPTFCFLLLLSVTDWLTVLRPV